MESVFGNLTYCRLKKTGKLILNIYSFSPHYWSFKMAWFIYIVFTWYLSPDKYYRDDLHLMADVSRLYENTYNCT